MAAKIRRLARNSKLGDDGGSGSSRFPANRTYRVSVFDLAISAFLLGAHGFTSLVSAGITPGPYASSLGSRSQPMRKKQCQDNRPERDFPAEEGRKTG
jgi:hypothetical protein